MTSDQFVTRNGLQAALGAGDDPMAIARGLLPLHRSWAETSTVPTSVRPVVARSWSRAGALASDIHPLDAADLRERRAGSQELNLLLPLFKDRLLSLATQAGNQLVISDRHGYVLWVLGPSLVRRRSDGIGFISGARWRESDVGTNGIGAAMAERRPVQIFGPEHAREEQHSWVCTAAPILAPGSGKLVGTITLSGSFRTAHPHTLALITSVAAEARGELSKEHERRMRRLSADTAMPDGDFILVDEQGLVAASRGFTLPEKVALPAGITEGPVWLPGPGAMRAARTQGGWLLQRASTEVVLELDSRPRPRALIRMGEQNTEVALTQRHWQILQLLAQHPAGVDSRQLAQLWEETASPVTVRAEVSRLRAKLGGLICSRPYRLLAPVQIRH